MEEAESWSK
jgi:hypothetical protein